MAVVLKASRRTQYPVAKLVPDGPPHIIYKTLIRRRLRYRYTLVSRLFYHIMNWIARASATSSRAISASRADPDFRRRETCQNVPPARA